MYCQESIIKGWSLFLNNTERRLKWLNLLFSIAEILLEEIVKRP